MEHCQLCYASLTTLFPTRNQTVCNGSQLQEILSKCNKYLSSDLCPTNPNCNLPFYVAPFCEECGENTQLLVQLDLKLEQVNSEIKQLIDRITAKILSERQNYQLPNSESAISGPRIGANIFGEGQAAVTGKPIEDTFDGWDLPSGSNSVYDSLQGDRGENAEMVSETVNASSVKRKRAKKSPKKQENTQSSLNDSKCPTKVTSTDLQLKSDTGGFACPNCHKKFTRLDILKRHDCGSQTYECETCGKSFSSQGSLQIHHRIHTGEKPHKCGTCGKGFTLPHHLRLHLLTHTEEKPFQCDICKKSFREKNYLLKHKVQHSKDENERRKYSCEICSKSFTLYQTLTQHLQAVHSFDARYKCKICGKACGTSHRLRLHELTHSGEKKFKCCHCWKTFSRVECLRDHEAMHSGGKDFQCDICGASYFTKIRLNGHIRRKHVNEGDFICDVCGRLYKTQAEMNQHRRLHDKSAKKRILGPPSKSFKCVVCLRCYTREDHMIKHQKVVHVVTTKNEIKCEVCSTEFEDHKEYHNHKVPHATSSDWLRYKCEICNENFRTRCEKICHFTAKHQESDFPFKCVCGSAFVGRKDLYRHKRNVCSVKRITTKKRAKVRKRSKGRKSKSEKDEKVHQEADLLNLRRSSRVRNKNVFVDHEESSEDDSLGKGNDGEQSEGYEDEQAVEIKSETDIWVKEEQANFSDDRF